MAEFPEHVIVDLIGHNVPKLDSVETLYIGEIPDSKDVGLIVQGFVLKTLPKIPFLCKVSDVETSISRMSIMGLRVTTVRTFEKFKSKMQQNEYFELPALVKRTLSVRIRPDDDSKAETFYVSIYFLTKTEALPALCDYFECGRKIRENAERLFLDSHSFVVVADPFILNLLKENFSEFREKLPKLRANSPFSNLQFSQVSWLAGNKQRSGKFDDIRYLGGRRCKRLEDFKFRRRGRFRKPIPKKDIKRARLRY